MRRRPLERSRHRLRSLHINRMIPNVLTLLALAAGLSSLRFALDERWQVALLALLAAAVLDALDGRIARLLKGSSRFGAELDSLSDFLCFGVAPALILYLWVLADAGRVGWALVLVFCIASALRLARFNADVDLPDPPPWHDNFFVGVPSPAGAGLVLMPMMLWFQVDAAWLRHPLLVGIVMVAIAALLVSRIRTYSFKKVRVPPELILPTMLAIGLYLAFLVSAPWTTLCLTGVVYLASIPFSSRAFQALRQAHAGSTEMGSASGSSAAATEVFHDRPPVQPPRD
ncbi:MAG: phosphatidylcholine/phosphatidylserine synthase [Rhodospirillales bacterium]|nr:MAG: phosphatidylcholine/phosphatidylserine synthase [Rhodospirillales bacterium]